MAWFFGKRDAKRRKASGEGDESESHRSPGLELVVQRLESHAAHSILDLGASTTENVEFFSRFAEDVMVVGLFQSCSDALGPSNQRSRPFQFDERALDALPKRDIRFAAVLLWDLLPYFDTRVWDDFARRLRGCLEPGALIYLLAANHAETSMVPMGFRVDPGRTIHGKLESCGLRYAPAEGDRATELQMRTRDVEGRMKGFEPVRLFQLRNGFQEFVFRAPEGPGVEPSAESDQDSVAPRAIEARPTVGDRPAVRRPSKGKFEAPKVSRTERSTREPEPPPEPADPSESGDGEPAKTAVPVESSEAPASLGSEEREEPEAEDSAMAVEPEPVTEREEANPPEEEANPSDEEADLSSEEVDPSDEDAEPSDEEADDPAPTSPGSRPRRRKRRRRRR